MSHWPSFVCVFMAHVIHTRHQLGVVSTTANQTNISAPWGLELHWNDGPIKHNIRKKKRNTYESNLNKGYESGVWCGTPRMGVVGRGMADHWEFPDGATELLKKTWLEAVIRSGEEKGGEREKTGWGEVERVWERVRERGWERGWGREGEGACVYSRGNEQRLWGSLLSQRGCDGSLLTGIQVRENVEWFVVKEQRAWLEDCTESSEESASSSESHVKPWRFHSPATVTSSGWCAHKADLCKRKKQKRLLILKALHLRQFKDAP